MQVPGDEPGEQEGEEDGWARPERVREAVGEEENVESLEEVDEDEGGPSEHQRARSDEGVEGLGDWPEGAVAGALAEEGVVRAWGGGRVVVDCYNGHFGGLGGR